MASYFGSRVRPAAIEKLLAARDYESFNLDMEHGAHLAAPHGVLGDFLVDTAPYGEYSLKGSVDGAVYFGFYGGERTD